MKHGFIIAALSFFVGCGGQARAQTLSTPAIDTLDDAATVSMVPSVANYMSGIENGTWTASVTLTRISGTAAGNVILQGSADGTNFINIECPCSYAGVTATTDSVSITNTASAQPIIFNCGQKRLNKIRVQVVGSGTQSTQVKGFFIKN